MADPDPPPAPPTAGSPPAHAPATWTLIVGVVFLGLAVLFLMGLVTFKHRVECEDRFLVVAILALCSAIGAGFLGNDAVAKGNIPIPKVANHPIAFSAGGGIATLVIVMVMGHFLYVDECFVLPPPEVQEISAARVDTKVVVSIIYSKVSVPAGHRLVVQCAGDDKFLKPWMRTALDDPNAGRAHFEMTQVPPAAEIGYLRLLIVDLGGNTVRESGTQAFTIAK